MAERASAGVAAAAATRVRRQVGRRGDALVASLPSRHSRFGSSAGCTIGTDDHQATQGSLASCASRSGRSSASLATLQCPENPPRASRKPYGHGHGAAVSVAVRTFLDFLDVTYDRLFGALDEHPWLRGDRPCDWSKIYSAISDAMDALELVKAKLAASYASHDRLAAELEQARQDLSAARAEAADLRDECERLRGDVAEGAGLALRVAGLDLDPPEARRVDDARGES